MSPIPQRLTHGALRAFVRKHATHRGLFEDEVRPVIESNATPAYDKAQALRL